MEYLSELSFLRVGRMNIQHRPWAKPVVRTAMRLYFKMERAVEELNRVRVEAGRLKSWIGIEMEQQKVFLMHHTADVDILGEITRVFSYRNSVRAVLSRDLQCLQHPTIQAHLATIQTNSQPVTHPPPPALGGLAPGPSPSPRPSLDAPAIPLVPTPADEGAGDDSDGSELGFEWTDNALEELIVMERLEGIDADTL